MVGQSNARRREPPEFLVVGEVVGPFGVRGEVKVLLDTDFPELVLRATHLFLGDPPVRYEVLRARVQRGMAVLQLAGCEDRAAAEALRGQEVQVRREEAPTCGEGEYYYYELIGLQVWSTEGAWLGEVVDIWSRGGNDVLIVRERGKEWLLPAVEPIVQRVDLETGRIEVVLPEGLR
ncbi:MAG: ribosome maturation factor RimM [Chloroflexia bacterium]